MIYLVNKGQTTVLVLGDVHCGAKTFNEPLFEQWLLDAKNYTKKRKKGKGFIILNGDLCDVARATQDAWGSTMSATEQIDYIVDALEPFKDNIVGSTFSNHESRAYREFNLDIGQEIANRLNVPYGIDCFVDIPFNLNGDTKRFFVKHGTRFSKSYLLFMRNFISDCNNIEADVFCVGHSHFLGSQTRIVRTKDGIDKKHYVVNGAFIDYLDSYAQKSGYDLRLAGYPIIKISEDGAFSCMERWAND